jgi:DNA polymerase-3 subunit delta
MNFSKTDMDRFFAKPNPAVGALLFFGPDQGLAHERAQTATRLVLGALDDPFRLAELTAREVAEDPARLADELNAIAMLGGRRVVKIAPAIDGRHNEALAEALADILPDHKGEERALLVIEAGDLPAKHALAQLFVSARNAAALRCFHDSPDELRQTVVASLRAEGHAISPSALDYLVGRLGDDRGVTRAELQKLSLYMGRTGARIELADVEAVIGDQAEIAQDDLFAAVAESDRAHLLRCFDRCLVDSEPIQLLRAMGRQFLRLHLIAARLRAGEDFESVAASLRPPLFWAIKARTERQCRLWNEKRIGWALARLTEAEAQAMRFHDIAASLARDGLVAIAGRAQPARQPARR